jgi:hypothetical protein
MIPIGPVDILLYRAALYLYPPAFREEYAPEMLLDFREARLDARACGRRATFWVQIVVDLCRSVVRQWLRTGLPLIGATAVTCSLFVVLGLVRFWRAPFAFPPSSARVDVLMLVFLSTLVLLVIATRIIFTTWFTRTTRQRRQL